MGKTNTLCIGCDIGTMNLCAARSDSDQIKSTRNVFLKVDSSEVTLGELSDIAHIKSEDGEIYIIGEDAFRLSNIFGKELSRPMKAGLISSNELDATEVLGLMIKDLIGDVKDKDVYVSYSIPAEAIDESRSVTYHEKIFGRIFSNLGVNHTPVNEAMAIIYSECAQEKFSGIAISFGAGMANCAISYRGVEAIKFSTAKSGDWVDSNVAESIGSIPNRVTNIKEKYLKLDGSFINEKDKKKRRILEALEYYYTNLIEYTVKKIIDEFKEKVDLEIDDKLPIIISGGTSLPEGFLDLFKTTIGKYDLPFEISEIRRAKNPLTSVASGLLVKTLSDLK